MDKKKLNNEIVLCRPLVRKAKVIVIRKILKKMKVLKSCKKESVKDKKFKKAERLFKKIQILKKLKIDDVTKFALRNNDLVGSTKKPTKNLKTLAFSSLAKYDLLAKKIQSIREQVPNWEIELPLLLDSIGKKKKNKKSTEISKKSNIFLKSSDQESNDVKTHENVITLEKDKKIKKTVKSDEKLIDNGRTQIKKKTKNITSERHNESDCDSEIDNKNVEKNETEALVKIDDPFFVGKKIFASKLLLEGEPKKLELPQKKFDSHKIFRNSRSFNFDNKPYSKKFDSARSDFRDRKSFNNFNDRPFEKKFNLEYVNYKHMKDQKSEAQVSLHPSWEAKRNQKAQLVKPFQGKKIKFSEA